MAISNDLAKRLAEASARVAAMSPEERATMYKAQQESWVRAEMSWPKAKYRWENGVKVYDSFEDYCNG